MGSGHSSDLARVKKVASYKVYLHPTYIDDYNSVTTLRVMEWNSLLQHRLKIKP